MIIKLAIEVALFVSSIYLLAVSVCVSARMTWKTSHLLRIAIGCMGGLAFWSVAKVVGGSFHLCAEDMAHATLVAMSVVTMLFSPRLSV
jgi:hypothetical protein